MPKGIFKHKPLSEEHKKKLSDVHKGRISNAKGRHWKIKDTSKMHHTCWCKGKKLSDEHRKNISESHKGYRMPDEQKRKIGIAHKGNQYAKGFIHSEETRKKMSLSRNGKMPFIMTKEIKDKISKTLKGRYIGDKCPAWKGGISKDNQHYCRERRVRKLNCGGSHTLKEWIILKAQYNWTCPCCHKSEPEIKLTEDHIIPLAKGGSDNIENIQPLCISCNCKKHTKVIKYEFLSNYEKNTTQEKK